MMEPAYTIIEICGGSMAVARMTGRHYTRVKRWTYDKAKGGTGGLIPADVQQSLLDAARAEGIALTPAHFFRPSSDTPAPDTPKAEDAA